MRAQALVFSENENTVCLATWIFIIAPDYMMKLPNIGGVSLNASHSSHTRQRRPHSPRIAVILAQMLTKPLKKYK
jgi:hypothetical protein